MSWQIFDKNGAAKTSLSSDTPVGTIIDYAGPTTPPGWIVCDGSAVSRIAYADLFVAIGTTYGAGDGVNTFNLPDAQGRTTVGKGTHTDVSALANSDGLAVSSRTPKHGHSLTGSPSLTGSVTLSDGGHSHPGSYVTSYGDTTSSTTSYFFAQRSAGASPLQNNTIVVASSGSNITLNNTLGVSTGTLAVGTSTTNAAAYLVVNKIIRYKVGVAQLATNTYVNAVASAYNNAGVSVTGGSWQILGIDSMRFQTVGGMVDTTNGRIVIQQSGIYQITAGLTANVASMSAGSIMFVNISLNGANYISPGNNEGEIVAGATNAPGQTAVQTLSLNAGDVLKVSCYYNGTGTVTVFPRLDVLRVDGTLSAPTTNTNPKVTTSSWAGGPPANPTDTDIWIATAINGAVGWRWQFQYNASGGTHKWEFIGGTPYINVTAGPLKNTVAGSWQNLASALNFTARAGEYIGTVTAYVTNSTGVNVEAAMSLYGNGGVLSGGFDSNNIINGSGQIWMGTVWTGDLPAGTINDAYYSSSIAGSGVTFAAIKITLVPVAIS